MDQLSATTPQLDRHADLIRALGGVHAQPLWDRYGRVTRREPAAADAPMCWRWADMVPLVNRACLEVTMEDAERRVLLLTHPAFADSFATTNNLSAGLQTLLPGEVARAHRHTLQAIRFVMEGGGALTSVNDQSCLMQPGDLILTPAWTWHEHVHPGSPAAPRGPLGPVGPGRADATAATDPAGDGRVVWFDGLDLPLCRGLDTMFFELAEPGKVAVDPVPTRLPALHRGAVVLPPDSADPDFWEHADAGSNGHGLKRAPSRFRYAKERAWAALHGALPEADGSRLLRYVNGDSQGAVLPTLDCYLLACARNQPTRRMRSTGNAVCVVAEGQGTTQFGHGVGSQTIAWQRNDVFTLPHWQWVSHTATAGDAVIFMMTDYEFLASLGYLREELA